MTGYKHGLSYTPEHRVWSHIINRCTNRRSPYYARYGGRGIKVCERWEWFPNFYKDMGPRPGPGYSIERINNDGDYKPSNCKWATKQEQARNRRSNRHITFAGRTQLLVEWAEETGISEETIYARINQLGWTVEKALTTPVRMTHRYRIRAPKHTHRGPGKCLYRYRGCTVGG